MARIKLPEILEMQKETPMSLEQEVLLLKKKVKNLYVLSYVSTLIIVLLKFIF